MKNIKRYAGSSAGAIVAAVLAIGYTPSEIHNLFCYVEWTKFKDKSFFNFLNIYRFLKKFGFCKGDEFMNWIGKAIETKTGDKDYTFIDLFTEQNKVLVVTGMCVNKRELHFYHYQSTPNMPIRLAVRISMGLPFLFSAINWKGDTLIDGGTLNNYPIYVFDNDSITRRDGEVSLPQKVYGEELDPNKLPKKIKTIGIKLLDQYEVNKTNLYSYNKKINNILDFTTEIINSLLLQIERLHVGKNYWERTIIIHTGSIDTVDLEITSEQKKYLIDQGYLGAKKFFEKS